MPARFMFDCSLPRFFVQDVESWAKLESGSLYHDGGIESVIVGTAGHIDHGKTALVKALTGVDADQLEEEKRRGITIDIGFAVAHARR